MAQGYVSPIAFTQNVLQQVRSSNTTFSTVTGSIPQDDTIPQITEGTEIFSLSITPKSSSSVLVFEVVVTGQNTAGYVSALCLFKTGTSNALACTCFSGGADVFTWKLLYSQSSGSTSAQTFTVRLGKEVGNIYINGISTGRLFGGVQTSYFTITEYAS